MAAQNTLRAGLTLVRKNMGLYALVVIISALHTVFSDWLDPDGLVIGLLMIPYYLIWVVASVAAYSTVLFDRPGCRALSGLTLIRFIWRDIAILCCALVPTVIIGLVIFVLNSLAPISSIVDLTWLGLHDETSVTIFVGYLIFGFCMFVLLSFVGTWLPAVVAGGDRRLATAFARGENRFETTLGELTRWVGPIMLVSAFCFSWTDVDVVLADGTLRWTSLIFETLALSVEVLLLVFTAIVVSRVYIQAEAVGTDQNEHLMDA